MLGNGKEGDRQRWWMQGDGSGSGSVGGCKVVAKGVKWQKVLNGIGGGGGCIEVGVVVKWCQVAWW